jgi:hypothetical protein
MAFNLMAAIGGAAKRGSEILKEERESAYDLIDQNMTDWTRLGVPAIKERKKLRMGMKNAADFLSSKGFTNDQIAVALYQNKYEQVVQHVTNLEAASKENKDLQYKPSDIITFGPDYQESGKTMDEILDGVMGKVQSGMSTADALADMGGSGLQRAFMTERAEAAAAASGLDVATLRAIATDDLEYGEAPAGGVISIVDPVASKQAQAALTGGETGQPGLESMAQTLFNYGADFVGGKSNVTAGGILYDFEQPERRAALNTKIADMLAKRGQNRFSAQDRNEMFAELVEWAEESGYYTPTPAGNDGSTTTYDFTGDPDTIARDYAKAIEGMDAKAIAGIFDAASAAALQYFMNKESDTARAIQKHEEWVQSVKGVATTSDDKQMTAVEAARALRSAKTLAAYENMLSVYMEITGRDEADVRKSFPPPAS